MSKIPSSLALAVLAAACTTTTPPISPAPEPAPAAAPTVGVLVMAHGGDEAWNQAVDRAVEGVSASVPVELAYGMANPYTLQAGLDRLAEQGVERVALVRAFLSGRSFLDQTLWYVGLADDAPETFVLMGPAAGDPEARSPLRHSMEVRTHPDGILDSPLAADILTERALEAGATPSEESVLLLAHGMGDEDENALVLDALDRATRQIRAAGFADVRGMTLREDWDDARALAEAEIRSWVADRAAAGDRVLVLPARLTGFGPYAEVLGELDYVAGRGLLPHPAIGDWILETANAVSCRADWGALLDRCPTVVVEEKGGG